MVGHQLKDNVLSPDLNGDRLNAEIVARLSRYRDHPDLLEDDKSAARARFLAAFSPKRYREQLLAALGAAPAAGGAADAARLTTKAEAGS